MGSFFMWCINICGYVLLTGLTLVVSLSMILGFAYLIMQLWLLAKEVMELMK